MRMIILFAILVLLSGCQGMLKQKTEDPWLKADQIVEQIQLPAIPDRKFMLAEFGGIGDGTFDNKPVFDSIIKACSEAGGGSIRVETGTYLVNGPIHLKSNINLHIEKGAKLLFGSDPVDYLPVILTSWEGTRCYNYSPFIYAFHVRNVSITGEGEIDGNGQDTWNNWKHLQDEDKKLIRKMNNSATPLKQRIFGEGHFLRPHLIQFYESENILVEDLKISDAPFWCLHFVYSKNITVRGLSYEAYNFNNDGIDPESSENVLIEDVSFGNGDDNIAIKAGRDLEARTLGRPSKNIVVRNCRFNGYNAIAVGSEMSGGVQDVYVEDCTYGGKVIYGFYLKGNRDRGGSVQDIYARNIRFDTTRAAIMIDSDYKNQGTCCPPLFKNIFIENITSNHAIDYGIFLKGSPRMPLDSIFIRDVHIGTASKAMESAYTAYVKMEEVNINGEDISVDGELPSWIKHISPETGREFIQITSDTAPAVACYFEGQAFTGDEKYVVYASRKSGKWRLYRSELATGMATAISPEERLVKDDDYTIMPDGERVCYMDGWKLYATHVEDQEEEVLFDFTDLLPDLPRFTGSFTRDGRYTLAYLRGDTLTAIYRIDLDRGEMLEVHRQPGGKITHPLINPMDPDLISYVPGPDTQNDMSLPMDQRARSWKIDLKAGTNKQFLTVPYGFRATHETWSQDGERFFFFRKTRPGWSPVAICSQDKNGGDFRLYFESENIRLGHGTSSPDGRWFVSDSQEPGKNELVLLNLESGKAKVLCWPNSSVTAGHDMQAHVHPSFSSGGNYIAFTSDRTGIPQVYVVPVGDITKKSAF